jgi:uncharacterized protein YdbL (DUF1318 family)
MFCKQMKTKLLRLTVLFTLSSISSSIFAADNPASMGDADLLAKARADKAVCELATGYIEPRDSSNSDINNLVARVNEGRRAEYKRISQDPATADSIENVAQRAGVKLVTDAQAKGWCTK